MRSQTRFIFPQNGLAVHSYTLFVTSKFDFCIIVLCTPLSSGPFLSGRAQPTADLLPLPITCAPLQLYIFRVRVRHTQKAPHTCRSELFRPCTDATGLLSFLCAREADRVKEGSAPMTFQSALHREAFFLLRNRNQQLTCHFCFDGHLWKAGHPHMSKVPLNHISLSQKR